MATNYTPTKHPVTVFKAACKIASHAAYSGPPLNGPLLASLTFVMPRPQSMIWKTKPMPRVPCLKKPDLDNLTKAVLDAMIGLAIVDDAMIFSLHLEKWIASGDEQPHVEVIVRTIESQPHSSPAIKEGLTMSTETVDSPPAWRRPEPLVGLGCCVILNDVEQPCARLVGVVVGIEAEFIRTKYLCDDKLLTPYNLHGCVNHRVVVTPLSDFGVELRVEGGVYWCEQVGASVATYPDGTPRKWQEYSGPIRHRWREHVMNAVRRG